MAKKFLVGTAVGTLFLSLNASYANAFSLSFDWGNIPKCTTGNPGSVGSPAFQLSAVPKGTAKLVFKMIDNNVPDYNHGGGTISYVGKGTIPFGAFKYRSPCPPNAVHKYTWTVTAFDKAGSQLGSASASRQYP